MTDLPELTDKQFRFVQGLLEGKTATDAYRAAYDCNGEDSTVWANASRLRNDSKVTAWLFKARTEALATAVMTKEAYLQELLTERTEAKETGNYGASVKALELAGKVMGHYVDRHEDVTDRPVLANVLSRIETTSPALAQALRASLGQKQAHDGDNEPIQGDDSGVRH